jgi:hypothetical protein
MIAWSIQFRRVGVEWEGFGGVVFGSLPIRRDSRSFDWTAPVE